MARRSHKQERAKASKNMQAGVDEQQRGSFGAFLKRNRVTLILVGVLILGLGIFFYPSFSNWWNSFHQSRAVMNYAEEVSQLDEEQYQSILDAAHAYNERLAQTGQIWNMTDEQTAEYNSLLDPNGDGIMGYIQIPKIDVQLPIYHGTDDSVLQTSIGHLAGTSLPVGGEGTHTVLSGHRGLPSARLFTDLDRLVEGDTFTLTILNETLTYEVDQIRIVEPTDLSDLQIEPGQDYCTLVTCTPYGINTQRLLVRGHRIANPNGDANVFAEAIQIRPVYIAVFIGVPVLVILFIYVLVSSGHHRPDYEGRYLSEHGLSRPPSSAEWNYDPEQSLTDVLREFLDRRRRGKGNH